MRNQGFGEGFEGQKRSKMVKKRSKKGQKKRLFKMVKNGQKWSKMVKTNKLDENGKKEAKMVKTKKLNKKCSKMIKKTNTINFAHKDAHKLPGHYINGTHIVL